MSRRRMRWAPHILVPVSMLSADTKRHAKQALRSGIHFGWTEVGMVCHSGLPKELDCGKGCKVYAIQRGCVIRFAVFHHETYGCKAQWETQEGRALLAIRGMGIQIDNEPVVLEDKENGHTMCRWHALDAVGDDLDGGSASALLGWIQDGYIDPTTLKRVA